MEILLEVPPQAQTHSLAISLRKRWLEWSLSMVLVIIGTTMLNHIPDMASERYSQLTRLFPPLLWAVSAFGTGVFRMGILYFNGRWAGSYLARVVTSIASLGLWYNFMLLAWSNSDTVLLTMFGLAFLPILLEGLGIVFALQERASAKEAQSRWFLHH